MAPPAPPPPSPPPRTGERGPDSNWRPSGYACHYCFHVLDGPVCGLDFLFTIGMNQRVPAIKSLHLRQSKLLLALGSGLPRERLPRI